MTEPASADRAAASSAIALPGGGLRDGELTVRPVGGGDAECLREAISSDESISRWTRIPWPYTLQHAEEFVVTADRGWRTGTDAACVMSDARTARILGAIGLHRIGAAPVARSSFLPDEVGYWVAAGERGRGLATRALSMLTRWAILELGRPFLNLQTKAGNDASQRVALRVGYRFVGRVCAAEVDDDPSDHDRFVISAADLTRG